MCHHQGGKFFWVHLFLKLTTKPAFFRCGGGSKMDLICCWCQNYKITHLSPPTTTTMAKQHSLPYPPPLSADPHPPRWCSCAGGIRRSQIDLNTDWKVERSCSSLQGIGGTRLTMIEGETQWCHILATSHNYCIVTSLQKSFVPVGPSPGCAAGRMVRCSNVPDTQSVMPPCNFTNRTHNRICSGITADLLWHGCFVL